ncbi:hypothetical protein HY404_01750 [Candidatus Microgenomates bacterium]|nr:hypothetical protein [Candidatus Microgenomates bacterium]
MICKNKSQTINKQEIITQIKEFYLKNGRVPFKNEFNHYSAARRRFGTWNNAIINANFDPNPVKFSKKHLAKDGHKCDSLAEKIIDDWLFKKKISHMRNTPYGKNNMNADFEINGVLIEFFGLSGELKEYDRLVRKKKKLWKNNKLKAIAIYPQDLFPQNRLGIILREFL